MRIVLNIVVLVAVGAGGYLLGRAGSHGDKEESTTQPATKESAVATVRTALIQEKSISQSVTAYGSVIAQPGEVKIVSVPFESRIGHLLVTPGQQVEANTALLELDASPDTQLAVQEARNAVGAGTRDVQQTQLRFDQHLTTNQELSQAQQSLENAKLKLDSLEKRGAGGPQKPATEFAGVVSKSNVQEGQIVPAGGSLVEIAVENRIEVKLGVEPADARRLKRDDVVELRPVASKDAEAVNGKVRLVTQRISTDTRMVDVFVSIPADSGLVLDSFVRARLVIASIKGLTVPRQAVLPDDDDFVMYTIADGKAVKHKVSVGLENEVEIEVKGEGLNAKDAVVISGNYVLEDGMGVNVESAP